MASNGSSLFILLPDVQDTVPLDCGHGHTRYHTMIAPHHGMDGHSAAACFYYIITVLLRLWQHLQEVCPQSAKDLHMLWP